MSKTARLYKIEALIRQRGHVSFAQLIDTLEVSPATLKRDLEYLRDQLGAPIEYDRYLNGYRFADAGVPVAANDGSASERRHELPGLWFSERELHALLMAQQLLSSLDDEGLIGRHLQPLLSRIEELLGPGGQSDARQLMKRVKIVGALRRPVPSECFQRAGEALTRRRRLHIRYLTRTRGNDVSEREVSPQRLVHYRNTWYMDAWCHSRDRLLRFALDAVQQASVLTTRAKDVAMKQVEAEMDAGYGIYAGATTRQAVLRFSAQAAPWISREEWHPQQQGRELPDGGWELSLPYTDETELVMDILRHGEQVQVVSPAALKQTVLKRLKAATAVYA
ncbi:helix-turn-helix transcriptional regulator [Pseudaquabacterium rugosum]|jgi:predicted DNA-binding transcriptional regulator YafY|uniref:WYL domain-containing protein n=1 Tax=Pseudaquabacterium rugosum TaxID=2984194 RepID=A0ABU9B6A2_9BURK